eukprot:6333424-Pyramimonas_sp.AAC.1
MANAFAVARLCLPNKLACEPTVSVERARWYVGNADARPLSSGVAFCGIVLLLTPRPSLVSSSRCSLSVPVPFS